MFLFVSVVVDMQNLADNCDEKLLNLYYQFWTEYSKGSEYLNNLFM